MNEKEIACAWCGDALDEEERENPRRDCDDDRICDECYHDEYEFTCEWCENYGETKDQHNLLLVLEADTVRIESQEDYLKPGVYQIVKKLYHGGPIVGDSYILWQAIVWLCDLPDNANRGYYPCGHLCLECQNKIWTQIGARPLSDKVVA